MKFLSTAVSLVLLLGLPPASLAQGNSKAATPVIVSITKTSHFADEIEALGTLRANESVELTSSVTEIITKVLFDDNQRVKKGDILVEMDTAEEYAEIAEQYSFTQESKRQVVRLSPLVEQGAASASILDENQRELEGAKARVKAIQSRINQRIIKAPFDGVLGLRNISVGALVQPGSIITTIDDDRVMKLDFSVPEIFLASLKAGVSIEAETEAYPGKLFKGSIAYVNSRIDPVTRSIEARALLNNDEKLLKPGLLMQVELHKDPREALLIPEEALIANGPDNFVYVIDKNGEQPSATLRKVVIGTRRYGEAEITSGLAVGEQIVVHGTLRVREGAPLTIVAIKKGSESLSELLSQGNKKSSNDLSNEEKKDAKKESH